MRVAGPPQVLPELVLHVSGIADEQGKDAHSAENDGRQDNQEDAGETSGCGTHRFGGLVLRFTDHAPERGSPSGNGIGVDDVETGPAIECGGALPERLQVAGCPVFVCPPKHRLKQCAAKSSPLLVRTYAECGEIPVRRGCYALPGSLDAHVEHQRAACAVKAKMYGQGEESGPESTPRRHADPRSYPDGPSTATGRRVDLAVAETDSSHERAEEPRQGTLPVAVTGDFRWMVSPVRGARGGASSVGSVQARQQFSAYSARTTISWKIPKKCR